MPIVCTGCGNPIDQCTCPPDIKRRKVKAGLAILAILLFMCLACVDNDGINYDSNMGCGPANWSACE